MLKLDSSWWITHICKSAAHTLSRYVLNNIIYYNTILGVGAVLRHVNTVDCDGTNRYQDLAPIEKNLNYDFNFQLTNYLPEEIIIHSVSVEKHFNV